MFRPVRVRTDVLIDVDERAPAVELRLERPLRREHWQLRAREHRSECRQGHEAQCARRGVVALRLLKLQACDGSGRRTEEGLMPEWLNVNAAPGANWNLDEA